MRAIDFTNFWGWVVVTLPLLWRVGNAGQRFAKDYWLAFFFFVSIVLFGLGKVDKKFSYAALSIASLAFINQHDFGNFFVINQFAFLCIGILLFFQSINNKINIDEFKKYLRISCLIQSVLVFGDYFGLSVYSEAIMWATNAKQVILQNQPEFIRIIGSMGHSNVVGSFIALTSVSFFGSWFLIIPIFALIATQSTMSIGTFLFCAAVYVLDKKRIKFLLCVLPLVFTVIAIHFKDVFSGRLDVWKNSFSLINNWVFGNGLGYVAPFYNQKFNPHQNYLQLHNEYLEVLLAFGFVGIAFLVLIFSQVSLKSNKMMLAIFLGTLVNSIGHFTYHISSTALIGILSLSCCLKPKIIKARIS